jgi:PPOX class probable F420-dependent enzyme
VRREHVAEAVTASGAERPHLCGEVHDLIARRVDVEHGGVHLRRAYARGVRDRTEPNANRPHMPGYGVQPSHEGTGILPWSWALERLTRSHDYWVATTWPDGRPHVMPVWGVWWDDAMWFSSGLRSRKARNLARDPRCVVTTDDARNPVVVEGTASRMTAAETIADFNDTVNAKYETSYSVDFYDPAVNGIYRVEPTWAFGVAADDFTGSPTRWAFDGG